MQPAQKRHAKVGVQGTADGLARCGSGGRGKHGGHQTSQSRVHIAFMIVAWLDGTKNREGEGKGEDDAISLRLLYDTA